MQTILGGKPHREIKVRRTQYYCLYKYFYFTKSLLHLSFSVATRLISYTVYNTIIIIVSYSLHAIWLVSNYLQVIKYRYVIYRNEIIYSFEDLVLAERLSEKDMVRI